MTKITERKYQISGFSRSTLEISHGTLVFAMAHSL